jgi:hypothetical protein
MFSDSPGGPAEGKRTEIFSMTIVMPCFGAAPSPPTDPHPDPEGSPSPDAIDTFGTAIQAFVRVAESRPPGEYKISRLLTDFGFQKRRMYDVMSVLSAIGCLRKTSADSMFWQGLSAVPATLTKLQRDAGVDSPATPLDRIVGSHNNVSIFGLTVGFLLCFLSLRQPALDIKHITQYLCRRTGRHKTTLCKLYQIAHILESAGVFQRSDVPGQLEFVGTFFAPIDLQGDQNPFAITSILNHSESMEDLVFQRRMADFRAVRAAIL